MVWASQVAQWYRIQLPMQETQEWPWRRRWHPTPLSRLGNPMDRGAWRITVHGVTKSWTRLSTCALTVQQETPEACPEACGAQEDA